VATARIFRSGNSQAVRLPKAFRFEGSEVEILRRGKDVILREKPRSPLTLLELIDALPDDMLATDRRDPPPQRRDGL
jgi:antitoxin VapB